MKSLERKLQSLYAQKEEIEQQIKSIEIKIASVSTHNQQIKFTKDEKIEIFKSLFIGRYDIYAKRWVSKDKQKTSYFPVTQTFKAEDYIPLTNKDIEAHLRGIVDLATFCIDINNSSKFVALNILDEDKFKLQIALNSLGIRAYYELDRNNSLIAWIFFQESISSKIAYNFARFVLKKANINAFIYPSQEFSTNDNLDKPLALPLHLSYRKKNKTVFIDTNTNKIYEDQWSILNKVLKVNTQDIYKYSQTNTSTSNEIANVNVQFPVDEIKMVLLDFLYIPSKDLSKSLLKTLKSFASFENPQIKVLLSLRKPLYNTPRVIHGFEEDETHLMLPRGLTSKVVDFFEQNRVKYSIDDKREINKVDTKKVKFTLRPEQEDAIKAILRQDISICVAPPGFGKTLIGAKAFEKRACSTLIVVNKNMLLDQWIERFVDYFDYAKKDIGFLGKGKNRLNGVIDVATMQSLKNSPEYIHNYSFVIVDECHHIPAVTFEQIIKNFKGKYVLGLSATPNRKDGLEPILYQQLGQIAYEYKKKRTHYNKLRIVRTSFVSDSSNYATLINELCVDDNRNNLIIKEIKDNIQRKILLLTDRIEHINILEHKLLENGIEFISIHGSMNKKEQVAKMKEVKNNSLILATTSYFGEGIDFPHLNTILFATPISYYGRLIQYLGRVGRGNQECLAIDFLDSKNPMLNSAYKKRLEGYKQMHYK
ncbi:MAG: TOTE conflict system archaeo-eukaryotic primase domain-containing protein [Campylobacterota bacterium]